MTRARHLLSLLAAGALAGCGSSAPLSAPPATAPTTPALPAAHPQAIEPVAGATPGTTPDGGGAPAAAVIAPGSPSAKPVSESTVLAELRASGLTASTTQAELTPTRLAIAPINAPSAVQQVIDAGNQIAHLPYVWGGGHGTYEDNGYDCSGSLSFVLSAAGLLGRTMTSGELMSWGRPGPGRWITVFAAAGHTFMYVAGLRFDTVALAETGSRWSNRSADEPDLNRFAVRHPAGL